MCGKRWNWNCEMIKDLFKKEKIICIKSYSSGKFSYSQGKYPGIVDVKILDMPNKFFLGLWFSSTIMFTEVY